MNSRRVHELMRLHFPDFDAANLDWVNVADERGFMDLRRLGLLIEQYICAAEVLVEVKRDIGTLLRRDDAASFIGEHVGQGAIRVADREFRSFVVVAQNSVATGWRKRANNVLERTPEGAVQRRR